VIYLELPLIICLYRVFKRRFQFRGGRTRPDLPDGCPEKVDAAFLKYILFTYYRRKKQMTAFLAEWQKEDAARTVIKLTSKKEINQYLRGKFNEKSHIS